MDANSAYLLQKIDCNCNNCYFMDRDMEKFKLSLKFNEELQLNQFNRSVERLRGIADEFKTKKYDLEKWDLLHQEADKLKFQFNRKSISIQYGKCRLLNKDVEFIPTLCQPETQECFLHRKDMPPIVASFKPLLKVKPIRASSRKIKTLKKQIRKSYGK